jgi:L-aspartate oxidase
VSRIVHDGPLIVGGGLAGLSAALEAGPGKALVVTPAPLLEACSSAWAQGGVAAALTAADAPTLHSADTWAAGAGLVDRGAAETLTGDGRATVEWLAALGAPFDRDAVGGLARSRVAAQ